MTRFPRDDGNDPDILFNDKSKYDNFISWFPSSDGTEPINWFCFRLIILYVDEFSI